jgi:putative thiamine transport system permease protein
MSVPPMPFALSDPRLVGAAGLFLSAALPMAGAAWLALVAVADAAAWQTLALHSLTRPSLGYSLWTGLASTALAWVGCALLLSQGFVRRSLARTLQALPVMLATPHAALAIGLVFLVSPSGWVLRLLSPWFTGLTLPPAWPTVQDPWGLGLIAALVAKELPFLLWAAATQMLRGDVQQRLNAEHRIAETLGYTPQRAFWHVVWPQLAPRMVWPLLAVLAYGLTVVDMAIVIGPASPPTLAVLAWQWLQDADPATNAQGAAAGGLLAITVALCAALATGLQRGFAQPLWARWRNRGHRGFHSTRRHARSAVPRFPVAPLLLPLAMLYGAVLLALAVGSVAGVWPFPAAWPQQLTLNAWSSVWSSRSTLGYTLGLAVCSSALALAWAVAWLELAPRGWDTVLRPLLYLPLVLPTVLWVLGLYGLALYGRLEGHWAGLLLAHVLATLPYVLLTLFPAYQGFDPRYASVSASLGHGPWRFLIQVKWPLLRRALAASAAVGFAVSVAQFVPTLYVGAGRFATVTTEAVTLASGGQRSLTSAYAWLQFVLPVAGFALAARVGRPRQFRVGQ